MSFFSNQPFSSLYLVLLVWVLLYIQPSFETPPGASRITEDIHSLGLKSFELKLTDFLDFHGDIPGSILTNIRAGISFEQLDKYKEYTQLQKKILLGCAKDLEYISAPIDSTPNRRINLVEALESNQLHLIPNFFQDGELKTLAMQNYPKIEAFLNLKTLPEGFKDIIVSNAMFGESKKQRAFIEDKVIMIDLQYGHHFRLAYRPLLHIEPLIHSVDKEYERILIFTSPYATQNQAPLTQNQAPLTQNQTPLTQNQASRVVQLIKTLHIYIQTHATKLILQALIQSRQTKIIEKKKKEAHSNKRNSESSPNHSSKRPRTHDSTH